MLRVLAGPGRETASCTTGRDGPESGSEEGPPCLVDGPLVSFHPCFLLGVVLVQLVLQCPDQGGHRPRGLSGCARVQRVAGPEAGQWGLQPVPQVPTGHTGGSCLLPPSQVTQGSPGHLTALHGPWLPASLPRGCRRLRSRFKELRHTEARAQLGDLSGNDQEHVALISPGIRGGRQCRGTCLRTQRLLAPKWLGCFANSQGSHPFLPRPRSAGPQICAGCATGGRGLVGKGGGGSQTQRRGGRSRSHGLSQEDGPAPLPPRDPVLGTWPVWPPRSSPPRNNHWSHTQAGHEGRVLAPLCQTGPLPDRQQHPSSGSRARPAAPGVGAGRAGGSRQEKALAEEEEAGEERRGRDVRGAGGQRGGGRSWWGRRWSQCWPGPKTPF